MGSSTTIAAAGAGLADELDEQLETVSVIGVP